MTDLTILSGARSAPALLFTMDFIFKTVEDSEAEGSVRTDNQFLAPPSFSMKSRTRRASSPGPGLVGSGPSTIALVEDDGSDGHRDAAWKSRQRSRTTSDVSSSGSLSKAALHGELTPPPPPLFRPNTFWRHTRRSAVTGPAYSPAAHVVRRAAFVAAGLAPDRSNAKPEYGEAPDVPRADLSALAVESRVGNVVLVPGFTGGMGMTG